VDDGTGWWVTEALYPFAKRHPKLKAELERLADELHPGAPLWAQEEGTAKKRARDDDAQGGEEEEETVAHVAKKPRVSQ
jgi:hypothetical protein